MNIRFVPQDEIDKQKWNSCVHFALNGHIFGYHWYLSQTAREWDALVEDDYHSVMPLPRRPAFWRTQELYQPELLRETAVYSVRALSPARVRAFWEAVPEAYRVVDLRVEPRSRPTVDGYAVEEQANYVLPLHEPYEVLAKRYAPDLLTRIGRAEDADLLPTSNLKPERIAELYRDVHGRSGTHDWIYHALTRIMYQVLHRGWGFTSSVVNRQQELLAASFFIYSHGRALSLVQVQTDAGRAVEAMPFLYDLFIRAHAGRPLILDFNTPEGELPRAFGATGEPLLRVQRDERAAWMRWL